MMDDSVKSGQAGTNARPNPRARTEGLVITEAADDVLIYDLQRHRAHSLNRTAALIWRQCDGDTPVAAIAQRVGADLGAELPEEAIYLGLKELAEHNLLHDSPLAIPGAAFLSRRNLAKLGIGLAGGAVILPLVNSIVSPNARVAASAIPKVPAPLVNPTATATQRPRSIPTQPPVGPDTQPVTAPEPSVAPTQEQPRAIPTQAPAPTQPPMPTQSQAPQPAQQPMPTTVPSKPGAIPTQKP